MRRDFLKTSSMLLFSTKKWNESDKKGIIGFTTSTIVSQDERSFKGFLACSRTKGKSSVRNLLSWDSSTEIFTKTCRCARLWSFYCYYYYSYSFFFLMRCKCIRDQVYVLLRIFYLLHPNSLLHRPSFEREIEKILGISLETSLWSSS